MTIDWSDLTPRDRLPKTPEPFDRDVTPLLVHARRAGATEIEHHPALGTFLHCVHDHDAPVLLDRLCPSLQRILMRKPMCPRCGGHVERHVDTMVFIGARDIALHAIPPLHPACASEVITDAPHLASRADLVITEATDFWSYERRIVDIDEGVLRYTITRAERGITSGIHDVLLAAPRHTRTWPIATWCDAQAPATVHKEG